MASTSPPASPSTTAAMPRPMVIHRPDSNKGSVWTKTVQLRKVSKTDIASLRTERADLLARPAPHHRTSAASELGLVGDLDRGRAGIGLGAEPLLVELGDEALVLELGYLGIDLIGERRILGEHDGILL